jgi:hypothetical protein
MKKYIASIYLTIMMVIFSVVYDAPEYLTLIINSIVFFGSVGLLFFVHFYEKSCNESFHQILLLIGYTIYNFLVSPILCLWALACHLIIFSRYRNISTDIDDFNGVIPLCFFITKAEKIDYFIILSYAIPMTYMWMR